MLHHSLGTSMAMWDDINIALAQHYRVLRYDARGHGASDAPAGPYDFGSLAGDAAGLMQGLGIARAYHVGLSMGGMAAQYLGFGAPDRVRGLVLVSTACQMPPEARSTWEERMAQVRAGGMDPQVESTLKRWFTKDFREDAENAELMEHIASLIRATSIEGYCGWGAAISTLDITAHLPRIKAPTLVMVGDRDPGTPPAMAQQIADNIPGARLQIFENASHMLALQYPDLFIESLIDFIEDCEDEAEV
jgi:3-oxoadipate enol-lactonase